jgi:TolB-like protein/class 3 adenylate cyclase/Flp pilus assembly protein TadD
MMKGDAMAVEPKKQIALEIAHVLFLDIVGYSKLSTREQHAAVDTLNELVSGTEQFQQAEAAERLLKIPTGDGMALVFYTSPEAPARCAIELTEALKKVSDLQLRMGLHSGSVSGVVDVTGRANLAGAGINIAQRVMDCGDAGHILLSKHAADDLQEYEEWRPRLHDLGVCEVKHGAKLHIVNLCDEQVGNRVLPSKLRAQRRRVRRRLYLGVVAALAACAVIALGVMLNRSRTIPAPSQNSVAILPFKSLVSQSRDPVLEIGMADTLITKLSNTGAIVVPSLATVRQFASSNQDPVVAGRKLGVSSVLEGNLQKAGDRLRVTVRLLRAADGSSLWAAAFDEKFTDVFTVEDTIAAKVAEALRLHISGQQREQLAKRYTESLDAYQLYLTGRYHWGNLSPPELQKAIEYFKQAIQIDPGYALAYFGLAETYRATTILSDTLPGEVMPASRAAAVKAIELDGSLAEPHCTLAMVDVFFDWDWDRAQAEAQRAIQLNPNLAWGYMAYGQALGNLGRHEEAIASISRARQLDPVSAFLNMAEGARLLYAGRIDEAEQRLEHTLELNPTFIGAYRYLGLIAIERRNYAQAVAMFTKWNQLAPGATFARAMIGYVAARMGDTVKAHAVLDELRSLAQQRYVPPTNIALVHVGLGETEAALVELERGYDKHDVQMQFLKIDKTWDPLRSDTRFDALLKRMGLQ